MALAGATLNRSTMGELGMFISHLPFSLVRLMVSLAGFWSKAKS